jgi:putative CocE/NonD family hydrolase
MNQDNNSIIVDYNVPATMRDGVELRADVYRPAREGKYPVLLQRTPYNKAFLPWVMFTMDVIRAARAGYVVVVQDVRGRFASQGDTFSPYVNEFMDGYDSVEWASTLPYCDGNVGMFGYSYYGLTQWQAAAMQPLHLKAFFPFASAMDFFNRRGGALELSVVIGWILLLGAPNALRRAKSGKPDFLPEYLSLVNQIDHMEDAFRALPLTDLSVMKLGDGKVAPYFHDILKHDTYDDYHKQRSMIDKHARVQAPAFIHTGWYDLLLGSDLEHFTRIKEEAKSTLARENTRLVVGPWTHLGILDSVGQLHYGLASSTLALELKGDLTSLHLKWFDFWLKGIKNDIDKEPPVKIFVMGDNIWRCENEWPLSRAQYTPFYFHSGGRANSLRGDGRLSPDNPNEEPVDQYVYDPRNPVPTRGGNHILPLHYNRGPMNQIEVEERFDVLVYSTNVLSKDIEVTGPVVVKLYASTSAPDTDFTAKLVDVHPDGSAFNIADGIIRARYRKGNNVPSSLIKPNTVVEYTIDLMATSIVFKAGHRMRVEISSSNFPRFDRNPNTGDLAHEAKQTATALQTILHDSSHPSHILLPIISH